MSKTVRMKCPSDLIRIIGGIYGAPYDDFALFFNGLKGAYTDYTDFSRHTSIPADFLRIKGNVRESARVRCVLHRIIRIIRIMYISKPYKSMLAELYGFQKIPYDTV